MASWPPILGDLKADLEITDDRDDTELQTMLGAAVGYVERVRADVTFDDGSGTGDVPDDLHLGTIRLAGRWHTRRRSPDGLVSMAELGSARVPAFDPDIERLLGIGRYRESVSA